MTVPEATLEDSGSGLAVTSEGWFLDLDNAAAFRNPKARAYFPLEDREHPAPDFGLNVHVCGRASRTAYTTPRASARRSSS